MADALNHRIHHNSIAADAPTVDGARGHRIAVGDLILSRRNDAIDPAATTSTMPRPRTLRCATATAGGSTAISPDNKRLIARRLDDNTVASFDNDYVREHITLGYAVTVHSAQGVTADTTHAVLGETATRSLLYVAMTRGRETNTAYLCQQLLEQEYAHDRVEADRVLKRGRAREAARIAREIIAHDNRPLTAHQVGAQDPVATVSALVSRLIERREAAIARRTANYRQWLAQAASLSHGGQQALAQTQYLRREAGLGVDL